MTKRMLGDTCLFFAVGWKDLQNPKAAAKKWQDYVGTVHHEIVFTIQEGQCYQRRYLSFRDL